MIDWQYIHQNPLNVLTSRQIIQQLCHEFSIRPTRGAGQNFVVDSRIPQMMADCADIKKSDTVLEIGPGFGALTVVLASRADKVIAVEKDTCIFKVLKKIMTSFKNVYLIKDDILEIPNEEISRNFCAVVQKMPTGKIPPMLLSRHLSSSYPEARPSLPTAREGVSACDYKLVANLPYSITSAVLRKFTSKEPKPEMMVVMAQKEVAERVCAKPGEMSLLSVAVQFYARPEIVKIVPREAFWPRPEVESAILRIITRKDTDRYGLTRREDKNPLQSPFYKGGGSQKSPSIPLFQRGRKSKISLSPPFTKGEDKKFFQLVRIGFSSRRKQLQNNLAAGLRLPNEKVRQVLIKAGFDPKVRAQDLSVEEWIKLGERISELSVPPPRVVFLRTTLGGGN